MNQAATAEITDKTPFDKEEWASVQSFLARLSNTQKLWLSGYLAALPAPGPFDQGICQHPGPGAGILIGYGGETGNSQSLAVLLEQRCLEIGLPCRVIDLAQAKVRHLGKERCLLVICSTHGEGEPPETITDFFQQLSQSAPDSLANLEYAVLALGDSSYEHFCKAGRDLDRFLARAGAVDFAPREEVDVDFAEPAARWMDRMVMSLSAKFVGQAMPALQVDTEVSVPLQSKATKSNPGNAELLGKIWLSDKHRENGYWHVELLVENMPEFRPGDALGIFPENPGHLIASVLEATGLEYDSEVNYQDRPGTLGEVLKHHVDLVVPGKKFLSLWSEWGSDKQLSDIVSGDTESQREFLKNNQIVDLLKKFPATVSATDFVGSLRPLQPRLYDITNYPGTQGDELHLLVKNYRYSFNNRVETGIASSYFRTLDKGMGVKYYVHANKKFHIPENGNLPMILIAHGSGIGPYRSFVQSFRKSRMIPLCWVIFLEKSFEEDFLYQLEWQQALEAGLVSRFDGLFDDGHHVRRLSNFLYQNRKLLCEWIDRKAHFYLCGDREILKSCEADISGVLGSLGENSKSGVQLWRALDQTGQVHRNYY